MVMAVEMFGEGRSNIVTPPPIEWPVTTMGVSGG